MNFENIPILSQKEEEPKIEDKDELIKKLLAQMEQMKGIEKENRELARENKGMKEQMLELKKNGVSGLRRREIFYRTLEDDIKESTGGSLENIEILDDRELDKRMGGWNLEELKNAKLSVLMSDLAYLSFANKEGHQSGDSLLKSVGDAAREIGSPEVGALEKSEEEFVAYRHGGDEFSGIIRGDLAKAEEVASNFGERIGKSDVGVLKRYGLEPHLDIGIAHISEAMEAFKGLVDAGIQIFGGDRMHKIKNLLAEIADQRAIRNKVRTRIRLLMKLKSAEPEKYKEVIDDLRKGALGAQDEEIDFLLEHNDVENFIDKKLEKSVEKNEEAGAVERNIVRNIVRRKSE